MEKTLKEFVIDLKSLENWRDPDTDLPMCSFATFYRVIGVNDFIQEYYKDHPELSENKFVPMNNVYAHVDTVLDIKHFIEKIWKTYDIMIDADGHVFWDLKSKYGKKKHYEKTLKAAASDAVSRDFLDYCPGADPSIPKNTIVIRIDEPE